jgi:hypothetical protein
MSVAAYSKSNSIILDGQVLSSTIDMDSGVITNHGTPVNSTDVVNKDYCDANSGSGSGNGLTSVNIILTGTNYTSVISSMSGNYLLFVKSDTVGGPTAEFSVSKNDNTRNASIIRRSSYAGTTSYERLEIRWNSYSDIEIRKTGNNYDGTYIVNYLTDN